MKFSFKSGPFLKAISYVLDVSDKGAKEFPGTSKINMTVSGSELEASAYSGKVCIKSKISDLTVDGCNFKFEKDGECTVDSDLLYKSLFSFEPQEAIYIEVVDKSTGGKEMKIYKKNDNDDIQTIPCAAAKVDLPELATLFQKEIEMKREVFVRGANFVGFAAGVENQVPQWLYWPMRISNNKKLRFIAGNGGRLAGIDIEGTNIVKSNVPTTNILFLKESIDICLKVISSDDSENIKILQSDPKDTVPYQIQIVCGRNTLAMTNIMPNLVWPDENKLINLGYTNKIITLSNEWTYASKGTQATFHKGLVKEKKPHIAKITQDFTNKIVKVETSESVGKSSRKISILDANSTIPLMDFRCVAAFVSDIGNIASKDSYVQIESIANNKPIAVFFDAYDKVSDSTSIKKDNKISGISERKFLLIATLNKDYD